MQPKLFETKGYSIAYIEKNETAANAVFFIHGNSGSHKIWEKQLHSPTFIQYHLIAIDLPGHGYSSPATNPGEDYSPPGTASILAPVIKTLSGNKPFVIVGFSYGTNLIAEMLQYDLHPAGIVFAGACVLGKKFGMEIFIADETIYFEKTVSRERALEFLSDHISHNNDIKLYMNAYFSTDSNFRPVLMQSAAQGNVSDEIELLRKENISLLVVNGEKDRMVDPVYLQQAGVKLWKDKIFLINDTGHFVHTDHFSEFNDLLSAYLETIYNTL